MALIAGTQDDDTLEGTLDSDLLLGLGGNDYIRPNGGFDTIRAGDGDDTVESHLGGSRAFGGLGNDVLNGGTGRDLLVGGVGNDSLYGADDADTLQGGRGSDTIVDSAGGDSLDGGAGIDMLVVRMSGTFAFDPSATILTPQGSTATNFERIDIFGGDGADHFTGAGRADVLRGWHGNDTLNGEGGNDFLIGDNGEDVLNGGRGHDFILGGGHSDILIGGAGNDTLRGGQHFDVFSGEDWLEGGKGADLLQYAGQVTNLTFANSRAGVYVDLILGRGYGGDAQGDRYEGGFRTIVGSAFDDLLVGGAVQIAGDGDDRLVQSWGTRSMSGGEGLDEFVFTFNRDILFERPTIEDFDQAGGERIDLSEIDAGPSPGRQPLTFIGGAAFSGAAGELRWSAADGLTTIEMTLDASGLAQTIWLNGEFSLTADDFILV